MGKKNNNSGFWAFLLVATCITAYGIWMIVTNRVAAGSHSKTLQPTGFGGHLLLFLGVVFYIVAYFSLSPFSKLREFLEGGWRGKRKG
ncbi:hypothetical protein RT717_13355 [Imperialibacter roseus]|uniref:Uncharacterized protein n=1 Tax=Imperialibacter roseus TaxID=1324217 RepID=A0ABZ0IYN5_9BACT|nr:hypothetical protein [Imperialibacter roseus]WOK09627.1 hypothetical protein RT717_13355 [Imperialibacter roseus]